ncbi:transcriptional repressor [Patescibacteria group bacterium]|nr:transcriptional repressor [Patescibacteria group bacterium]
MNRTAIKHQLRENGLRLTRQLDQVLGGLTDSPQSAGAIFQRLRRKNIRIDRATVYRVLDRCVSLNLVLKTRFQEQTARYELDSTRHHHHLVCDGCGRVEDVIIKEEQLLKLVDRQSDFFIRRHNLEFFGDCHRCQKRHSQSH